jgi:predicted DCC family thiol-disulfide oxidoreductase YuxK
MQSKTHIENPVVLFDGVCNLCNNTVDFLMRKDSRSRLRFASLQGELGRSVQESLRFHDMQSIIFLENGHIYTRSTAVLRIMKHLDWPWSLMSILLFVPVFVRDWIYSFVAQRRYSLFGKRDTCRVPSPEEKSRFID